MDKNLNQKIKEISDKIVKEYEPEKIVLFGSHAWGEPHEWSDVDLFIIKESNKNILERIRDVRRILFNTEAPPIDILVYTPAQMKHRLGLGDPFLKQIFSSGKTLYAR